RVLVVVDGLDELRRVAGDGATESARQLFQVLNGLRLGTPNHEALRILITSRTYDWDKTVAGPIRQRFVAVGCPELATHETSAVGDEFGAFLAALREPLRSIVMARPLLLRLGFELWLRRSSESLTPDETINDLPSELALWLKYYEEVVCTPDVGPTSSI